jgi:hypothetical protein
MTAYAPRRRWPRLPRSSGPGPFAAGALRAARRVIDDHDRVLTVAALTAIAVAGVLHLLGEAHVGDAILAASVGLLLVSLVLHVGRTMLVDRRLGVDVIALVAMAGALALGEYFAGAVVALMFLGRAGAGGGGLPARPEGADRARAARSQGRASPQRRHA